MREVLPPDWAEILGGPALEAVEAFVAEDRRVHTVFPPEGEVYTAFRQTPFRSVKVLLLGQDPYHGPGQAHGLSFSVKPGVTHPPSLVNMYKELRSDLGIVPTQGNLTGWAEQGVLLLNAVLTVRQGEAGSHAGKGWEKVTDAVIDALDARSEPLVFALWGGYAKKKGKRIRNARHRVIEGVHPSPLSAYGGFFGSRPYSRINAALSEIGQAPVDWRIP